MGCRLGYGESRYADGYAGNSADAYPDCGCECGCKYEHDYGHGDFGALVHTATFTLKVAAAAVADFTLAISPTSLTLTSGRWGRVLL